MSKPSSGGRVFSELKQICLANAPLSTTKLTNQAFLLFALFIILWRTVFIKKKKMPLRLHLNGICQTFVFDLKVQKEMFCDISLEFPVIPEGQTKGIVSSLSSCCGIISSDKNRRQSTTGPGLCKNSLLVHNIKPQLPEAALLMT